MVWNDLVCVVAGFARIRELVPKGVASNGVDLRRAGNVRSLTTSAYPFEMTLSAKH